MSSSRKVFPKCAVVEKFCIVSSVNPEFGEERVDTGEVSISFYREGISFVWSCLSDFYEQADLVWRLKKAGGEKFFFIGRGKIDCEVFIVEDHVNLSGQNPLLGADQRGEMGERFLDVTALYDGNFNSRLESFLRRSGIEVNSGILLIPRGLNVLTEIETKAIEFFKRVALSRDIFAYALGARFSGASFVAGAVVSPGRIKEVLKFFDGYE